LKEYWENKFDIFINLHLSLIVLSQLIYSDYQLMD